MLKSLKLQSILTKLLDLFKTDKTENKDFKEDFIETNPTDPETEEAKKEIKKTILSTTLFVLVLIILRVYVVSPFIVSGKSMYPTFDSWHYILIDKISYRLSEPKRGDVIVFHYPRNPKRYFIKRIIGLPGEKVEIKNSHVKIYNKENPDGIILNEPYIPSSENTGATEVTVVLGDNEYFVMGDNRDASADSRMWGPLDRDKIVGKAFIRLFPFSKIELFPGSSKYEFSN